MSDWMNLPPQDLAEVTISVVVPRNMMSQVPNNELREAVHGVLGEDVHHLVLTVGNVRDETYNSAQRRKSFDDYMQKSGELLQPLVDHIGGYVTQTGGGCLAVTMGANNGDRFGRSDQDTYILVTDYDGPLELPTEDWTLEGREYCIGVYDGTDEGWVNFSGVTFDRLPEGIELAHLIAEKSTLSTEENFATIEEAKERYA